MENKNKMIKDYTQGPITKQLILFSLPFMASNAMQVLYSLVDMIVVGKFVGSFGLSAVSTASQVFTFMTMISLGFCTGGQVLISQLIGSKKIERLNQTIGTLFSFMTLFGIVMTLIGLIFKDQVLTLLNTPSESYALALDYLLVCSIGIIFSYGYNLVSAILRGMGDSKHPFIFIMIASIVNLVLDLLFVGVFHWSVAGAALATIMGQGVSFIWAMQYLYKNRHNFHFDFKKDSFRIDLPIFKQLCSLGIPFALQSGAINISMMFVNGLVNGIGVYASAAFGVGLKLDDIVNKITQGVTFAVSAMIGQNFAARKFNRIMKIVYTSWIFSSIFYIVYGFIFFIFSKDMFGLFTSDANVISLAPTFVSAILVCFPAMVLMRGTNGFIQGIGNAKLSLIFALLDGFVFRITLSYVLGIVCRMGLYGFILGYALAPYGTAVPCIIYMVSGRWKDHQMLDL